MTAMSQYLAEARMAELRQTGLRHRRSGMGNLLVEAAQVLRGAITPTCGASSELGRDLRQDLGLN